MGITASTTFDSLSSNALLVRLVGRETIGLNDSFWTDLLAFTFSAPLRSEDSKALTEATLPLCQKLVENGVASGNLYTLVQLFVWRCELLCHAVQTGQNTEDLPLLTYNSLLLIRQLTQHLILVCAEDKLESYFNATAPSPPNSPAARPLKTVADSSSAASLPPDQRLTCTAPVRGAEAAPPAHATSGSGSSSASSPSSLASMPFVNQARQMMSAESGYAVVDDDITVPLAKVFAEGAVVRPTAPAQRKDKPAAGAAMAGGASRQRRPAKLTHCDSAPSMLPSDRTDGSLESLLDTLCSAISTLQAGSDTLHDLLLECMQTFLVLLSTQQDGKRRRVRTGTDGGHAVGGGGQNMGFALDHLVMNCNCCKECVRALLTHFVKQPPAPEKPEAASLLSGLWSMVFTAAQSSSSSSTSTAVTSPLAHLALHLLLVLTNYFQQKGQKNPFHFSLACIADDRDRDLDRGDVSFPFHLDGLYNTLCSQLTEPSAALLLYIFLHNNPRVSGYILSRTDIENLVLPLLQMLYTADESQQHHILMLLINILILTQDEQFNRAVHEIELKSVPWYKERGLGTISLGSLMVLVLLRIIQLNMAKIRDKFLHNNCLAALANMSASFRDLNAFAAQRLLGLFEALSKKHQKLLRREPYSVKDTAEISDDQSWDLPALEEVLRTILEIVNAALTSMLVHNQHLIYALLHRQRVLAPYSTLPAFSDIMSNIDMVLTYFSSRLEDTGSGSVEDVLAMISKGARQWPADCLARFPELRYQYVEEEHSVEFFIPYIWSLVQASPIIHLKRDAISSSSGSATS
eukprot:scpid20661/ scgid10450/ Dymeclin